MTKGSKRKSTRNSKLDNKDDSEKSSDAKTGSPKKKSIKQVDDSKKASNSKSRVRSTEKDRSNKQDNSFERDSNNNASVSVTESRQPPIESTDLQDKIIENLKDNTQQVIDPDDTMTFEVDEDEFADEEIQELENVKNKKRKYSKQDATPKRSAKKRKSAPGNFTQSRQEEQDLQPTTSEESRILLELRKELAEVKQLKQELQSKIDNDNTINNCPISDKDTSIEANRTKQTPGVIPVKSGSDTTMYAPAVRRVSDEHYRGVINEHIEKQRESIEKEKQLPVSNNHKRLKDLERNISQMIQNIRLDKNDKQREDNRTSPATQGRGAHRRLNFDDDDEMDEQQAKQMSQERIRRAEQFKAKIEAPKGKDYFQVARKQVLDDDEFIFMTSHIEDSMTEKVEGHNFIELDKLTNKLPITSNYNQAANREELKVEVVHKGGMSFVVPKEEKGPKIHNFQTWERAFRIYMAIYTRAYPERALEMLQYIDTIQHASTKYTWENVAHYDVVFRRMMSKNPYRSWGKTFNQMWSLCLCDPLSAMRSNNNSFGTANGTGNAKKSNKGTCWKFNRGICRLSSTECRYIHRCTFCGGTNHGAHNCFKKNGRKSESKSNNNSQSSNGSQIPVQVSEATNSRPKQEKSGQNHA